MNYLDLLPNDAMKIVNRKGQYLHLIERKKEEERKKKMNREHI